MGVFGNIKGAKYSDGGVYILPGTGRIEIVAIEYMEKTRKGAPGFIVEIKYLESSNPERPVGSLATWFVGLDKEPSMGNVKQFVETILPESKALFDKVCATKADEEAAERECEQLIMAICAETGPNANPMKGRKARFSATNITTKKNAPFTKVKWLSDSLTAEQVAAEAAKG